MRGITLSSLLPLVFNNIAPPSVPNEACVYPQSCWPSSQAWTALNWTLGGSLVRARPPAYHCHEPTYNQTECQEIKTKWGNQFWRAQQPGGYFDTAWENGDSYCYADDNTTAPCDQGLVPVYVAQAKSVVDVQIAVKFAQLHKLSTRVKGASHDFLGRSSGNGTFGIQTINLKGIDFTDNFVPSGAPSGIATQSAVHIGAGEQWWCVYKAADDHGVIVVGGSSYSTGAAGGWILGGGHSSLSPQYGLGVDNVLQFEIVTPDGVLRTANAYQNEDLFWALRGGGPGFGVVTKVTYKTYPAIKNIVYLNITVNYTPQSYPNLLRTYMSLQPTLSAQDFSGYTYPVRAKNPTTNTNTWWSIWVVHNSADVNGSLATLEPLYDLVQSETAAGRPMSINTNSTVLHSYLAMWPDNPSNATEYAALNQILGSRLLPISAFEGNLDAFVNLLNTTDVTPMFCHVSGGKVLDVPTDATAINPSWRNSIHHLTFNLKWQNNSTITDRQTTREHLTEETQRLAALFPGQGSYVNEGDINEPNWEETFWGSNYPRLAAIKKTYDPLGIFTCYHCVGYIDGS